MAHRRTQTPHSVITWTGVSCKAMGQLLNLFLRHFSCIKTYKGKKNCDETQTFFILYLTYRQITLKAERTLLYEAVSGECFLFIARDHLCVHFHFVYLCRIFWIEVLQLWTIPRFKSSGWNIMMSQVMIN